MADLATPQIQSHPEWEQWRKAPNPANMARVVKSVNPLIESTVKRYGHVSPALVGGEARRLAISAIKTYDPTQGASLPTHIFNHLRPLTRYVQTAGKAINTPRDAREGLARYVNAQRDFFEEHNREATDDDLQDILGVDRKKLTKLHQMANYEFPEGGLESSPDVTSEDDRKLDLWADFVYHDLSDRDKLIMDHRLGRNGRPILDTDALAAKLKIHPSYVNRRAQEIAEQILKNSGGK